MPRLKNDKVSIEYDPKARDQMSIMGGPSGVLKIKDKEHAKIWDSLSAIFCARTTYPDVISALASPLRSLSKTELSAAAADPPDTEE